MATDVSIRVGVDGEAEFRSALNGINSQIRNLNSEMKSVVSGFTGMDNAEKKTAQQTEVLGRKMEATKQKISVLSAEYDRQRAKLNQLGNELDQLQNAQDRDEAAITKATNAYNRQQTVVNNLGRQINDATADMNRMEQEMDDLTNGAKETANALDDAGDKASGFGSKVSSGFTVLKGIAANVIADGIQAIASSLTSLAGEAVDAADSLTKFESTMSFAGFSTDEINSVSAAMQEYASRTVYDLQTVANTVAQLGANGVADYEQLTEAAGNLNAVAGGNADTFRSVAMVLTQTAGAGKLTTENWNQLADAIPGASGLLQQAMAENGAYVGNFREAMENGEITADEFSQAIMQLGMTDTAQQAAESVETIEGAMGNLKATVVDAMTSILTEGGGMNAITMAINGITSAIQFFIENASTIVPILAGIGAAFAALQIGSFAASVVGLITQLGGLGAAFTALGGVISAAVTAIGGPITIIVAAIAGIATALIGLWNTNETFRTSVIAIWENIKVAFQTAWQFIQSVWAAAQPYFQAIGTAIQTVFTTVTTVISTVFSTAYNVVVTIWNAAVGFFQGVWNGIQAVFSVVASVLGGFFSAAWDAIQGVWNTVVGFFQGVWSGIQSAFSSVQSFFSNAFTSAKNAVQNAWNGITSFFSGIWSDIKGVFSDVWSAFSSIGSDIVNGIKSGISNAWGNLTGWISDKVNGLVSGVKGLLGIASPSKVFAEIGAFMAEGMAVGIEKGMPDAVNAADEMARAVTDASAISTPQVGSSFAGAVEAMTEDEPTLFDYVASLFERLNAVVSEYLTELLDMAHSTLTSYFNQFQQAGKYLMEGVAAGVRAGRSGVINAIEDALWAAVAAAKAAMEISSPSRVFEEIGKYMGQGIGVGFDAAMVPVNNDITRTMMQPINQVRPDDVYNAAAGAVTGLTSMGGASTQTIVIPVNLNGKQIAEVIYDPLRQVGKQRGVALG